MILSNRAEAAQLYSAAGFSIRNDQPVNRCGKPAKPRVTFVDLNGDKRPEALFIDVDAACYAGSGRYFAVLIKDGTSWRPIISSIGSIEALSSRTVGWLDMRVSDSSCVRDHRYDGRTYKPTASCPGRAVATAPRAAQPAPGTAPDKNVATTLQAADEAAAFKVAGFTKRGGAWRSGCNDPGTASYSPGAIDKVDDLNGDGLPDVWELANGTDPYTPDADADPGGPHPSTFSVFRKRDFRLLWSAQLVSTIGTALTDLAAKSSPSSPSVSPP